MSNMVSTNCLLDPKTFSQHLAMGWLTYIGVRAQRLGSSLGAVFTLGEPPDLHPWLQVQPANPGTFGPVLTLSS